MTVSELEAYAPRVPGVPTASNHIALWTRTESLTQKLLGGELWSLSTGLALHKPRHLTHGFLRQQLLRGLAQIEFGVGDIVVAECVHELPGAGATFGQELAEGFPEAVKCAALR